MEDGGAQGGQGLQSGADRERFLWRIDQFEQLGFSESEAAELAESDAAGAPSTRDRLLLHSRAPDLL